MKQDIERNVLTRSFWLGQNREAWVVNSFSYLKREWNKANETVFKKRQPVVVAKGYDEFGTLVPVDLLYMFHLKGAGQIEGVPVCHIDSQIFRKDFEKVSKEVERGYSYVLLKDKKPYIACVSESFRETLELNSKGEIDFTEVQARVVYGAFPKKVSRSVEKKTKRAYQHLFSQIPPINEEERKIMEDVLGRLRLVEDQSITGLRTAISSMEVDLKSTNQATNEI